MEKVTCGLQVCFLTMSCEFSEVTLDFDQQLEKNVAKNNFIENCLFCMTHYN